MKKILMASAATMALPVRLRPMESVTLGVLPGLHRPD
jgi:hypothetical protein